MHFVSIDGDDVKAPEILTNVVNKSRVNGRHGAAPQRFEIQMGMVYFKSQK